MDKGSYLLGGQLSFNKTQNETAPINHEMNATMGILFGKAIKKNTFIGIHDVYSWRRNTGPQPGIYERSNDYYLGLFLRKYNSLGNRFFFFYQADAAVLFGNGALSSDQVHSNVTRSTGGRLASSAGFSFQLYKKLQLEITLNNLVYGSYATFQNTGNPPGSHYVTHQTYLATNFNNGEFLNNVGVGFNITF